MEAGVTDWLYDIEDIIKLVDDATPKPKRPETYKKKISNWPITSILVSPARKQIPRDIPDSVPENGLA